MVTAAAVNAAPAVREPCQSVMSRSLLVIFLKEILSETDRSCGAIQPREKVKDIAAIVERFDVEAYFVPFAG